MKYSTLISCLVLASGLVLPGPAGAAEAIGGTWLTEVEAARAEAQASDRYILVDLYADWCGWCRKLEKEVFTDPAFVSFAKAFVKLRVDVEDGGEGEELHARYRVSGLPTLLVLSPKMALAGSVEGYAPRDTYIRKISDLVARYRKDLQTYDQLLERDDPRMLRQIAEELHEQGDGARAARAYRRLLDGPTAAPRDRPRDLYLLADALRLDLDFEGAAIALAESRRRAQSTGDQALLEACDLLKIRLAQDRGGCADLIAALERFLSDHPSSPYHRTARRSLDKLNRSSEGLCT